MSRPDPAWITPDGRVKSPCVQVCRMSSQGWCEGCFRTLDEIGDWSDMSAAQQLAVWQQLEHRRQPLQSDF